MLLHKNTNILTLKNSHIYIYNIAFFFNINSGLLDNMLCRLL